MDHKGVENAETAFVFRQMMKCNLMLVRARAVVYPSPLRGNLLLTQVAGQNDLSAAIDACRRCIDIRMNTLEPTDEKLIETLVDGAMLHNLAGLDGNANQLFEEARRAAVNRDGEGSLLVAHIDFKLGMSFEVQGMRRVLQLTKALASLCVLVNDKTSGAVSVQACTRRRMNGCVPHTALGSHCWEAMMRLPSKPGNCATKVRVCACVLRSVCVKSVVAANARRVRVQSASSWALHLLGVPQHQRNSSSHLVAEMRV